MGYAICGRGARRYDLTSDSGPIRSTGNRIGSANFTQRCIVPIGYAFFALSLGALVGTILDDRRRLLLVAQPPNHMPIEVLHIRASLGGWWETSVSES